jgi:hypothetical protein
MAFHYDNNQHKYSLIVFSSISHTIPDPVRPGSRPVNTYTKYRKKKKCTKPDVHLHICKLTKRKLTTEKTCEIAKSKVSVNMIY